MHIESSSLEKIALHTSNDAGSINAYVFIQTRCGTIEKVVSETRNIKHVLSTEIISGNYDVVLRVNVHQLEDLHRVSERIKMISGINQAITHIIEKEIVS
jgi:hypothetical protein